MKIIILAEIDENHLVKETNELYEKLKGYDCVLKPLPQKRILPEDQTMGTNYGVDPWFSDGWNACLEEITGGFE